MRTEPEESRRRVSTPKLVAILLGIMLALSLVMATQVGPASPEGKYYDKFIATEGLAYYEFKDGTVSLVLPLGAKLSEGTNVKPVGTYTKKGEIWIWTTTSGDALVVRAGLFGIEIEGLKTDGSAARYPRYWFPR